MRDQTTLDQCLCASLPGRHQHHANAKRLFLSNGQIRSPDQEIPRNRGRHTDTITALSIRCSRATVGQSAQCSQGLLENLMRRYSIDCSDKSNTAGVVIKALVDQRGRTSRRGRDTSGRTRRSRCQGPFHASLYVGQTLKNALLRHLPLESVLVVRMELTYGYV